MYFDLILIFYLGFLPFGFFSKTRCPIYALYGSQILFGRMESYSNTRTLNAFLRLEKAISIKGKNLDTLIVGRRKPFLDSVRDKARITNYVDQFNDRYEWYLKHSVAAPEEFNLAG